MSATAEGATMRDEHEPARTGTDHRTDLHADGRPDRPDEHADFPPTPSRGHQVHESDVRLALERLGLGDRALNVHRATAFLTALGVTVTHDGPPAADDDHDEAAGGSTAAAVAATDVLPRAVVPVPSQAGAGLRSPVGADVPTPRDVPVPSAVGAAVPATSAVPTARVTVAVSAHAPDAPDAEDDPTDGDVANLLEVLAHLHDRGTTTLDDLRGRPRTLQRPTAVATA